MSNGSVSRSYVRPPLPVSRPNRRAGGFYRSAGAKSQSMGGVPLDSAEAAVVAAVRMGYKVAATQIDRSARLARRLRDAGDRVSGGDSTRQAVDATERLIFRSMMAGLTWLEVLAAERGSPLRRLAAAEFSLLGKVLGVMPVEKAAAAETGSGEDRPTSGSAARARTPAEAPLRVKLTGDKRARRAVTIVHWAVDRADRADPFEVYFHHAGGNGAAVIDGKLHLVPRGTPELALATRKESPSGIWRASVCTEEGVQMGIIEIEL
jgi:hypothetical protein